MYAAPFKHDENWYRIRVIKLLDSTVEVLYVDYGDYDTIDCNQLKTLKYVHYHVFIVLTHHLL